MASKTNWVLIPFVSRGCEKRRAELTRTLNSEDVLEAFSSNFMESDIPQLKKRKMSPATDFEAPVAPEPRLLVKRLSKNATLPTRGSALAAGYDLYRCENLSLHWGYNPISAI
jgi:hypothetical protein